MTPEKQAAIETTVAAVGGKATYAGSGSAVLGWLMSNEFAVVGGLLIGFAGLLVNWYYKRKSDRRKQAEHDARMGLYQ